MAQPTTTYSSGFPDFVYPKNTQQERTLADNRLIQLARDYNVHDQEICAMQQYIGVHPTSGWDPTAGPGGGGGTINERIVRIAGTGGCIEQGVICNFGGAGGIDPGGQILGKTGEVPELTVAQPTGCIPLEPPSATGFFNPEYPDMPPWNPPTNPGFPDYPVPDTYPWPTDFDPDVDDGFPVGPWMQWVTWGVGYMMVQWQMQNAGNINLGPAGLIWNGVPQPWKDLMTAAPVFSETTQYMPVPDGQSFQTPDVLGRASMFNAFDITLTTLSALKNMLGVDYVVLTGNGTDTISSDFSARNINCGVPGDAHSNVFTVLSPDEDFLSIAISQVEQSAVKLEGFKTNPGTIDFKFTGPVYFGTRVVVVFQSKIPSLVTDAANNAFTVHDTIAGGPTTAFVTNDTLEDAGNNEPNTIVWRTDTGAVLKWVSSGPGTGEWTYTPGTKTITTGDVLVEIGYFGTTERDAT